MNKLIGLILLLIIIGCKTRNEKMLDSDKKGKQSNSSLNEIMYYNTDSIVQDGPIKVITVKRHFFNDSSNRNMFMPESRKKLKNDNFNAELLEKYTLEKDLLRFNYFIISEKEDQFNVLRISSIKDSISIYLDVKHTSQSRKLWLHQLSFEILVNNKIKKPIISVKYPFVDTSLSPMKRAGSGWRPKWG